MHTALYGRNALRPYGSLTHLTKLDLFTFINFQVNIILPGD